MRCLDVIVRLDGEMRNLDHFESDAVEHASEKAGAYLEAIGKYDLSELTPEQWFGLVKLIYVESTGKVQELHEAFADDVPY